MSDLNLTSFNPLYPMRIHPYKELLNDSNVNIMDKVNAVIDYLNQVGKLTNDVVKDWNTVYQWVMNDGLTTDVNNKLEQMLANHEFDPIMNDILTKIGDLTTLQTADKDTIVHAVNDLVTEIGSLSSLQTSDKTSIVNAINANVVSLAEIATQPQRLSGETDDSPAINRAIANGATVIQLPVNVQLNSPINATNRADKPLKFIGQGWSQQGGAGTIVHANTGGIAFDCTGSQYVTFEDMLIYSDSSMSNPSTIGILVARSNTSQYAQFHSYKRLYIMLVSNPSATAKGTIGILNISGEHMNYEHGFIIADLPFAMMDNNVLNVSSPFTTIGTVLSMTLCTFKQVGFRPWTQSAMILWNTQNVEFNKCYWSPASGNTTVPAIVTNGNCNNIKITGQIEEFPRAIQFNNDVTNIDLDVFMASATTSYVYLSAGIKLYNCKLAVYQANGSQQQMITAADANIILYGGEITLQPNQGLNASTLTLQGTNIKAINVALASIVLSTTSLYTINNSPIASYQTGSNGYVKYLNGLTEQWMNVLYNVTAGTDQVFNLPTAFTNACDNVTVTPIGASNVTATNNGSTASTVTLRCSATGVNLLIRVIGH